ncbi:MAG: chromosome segregation protein SMC, partial [Verrucomicrobia bacterium]|nr:chromosome segregation protein SMC [Verrucomicrobiota bacterium]
EDAAGITKYKAQKKEALRKLEYTDANLIRLADIMKEIKRQIGSLQRQAGKARRFKTLFDDLRTLDTHFSRKSRDDISLEIGEAEREIERLNSLHRSLEEQLESQEFGLSEQRREIETLEAKITDGRQLVQELRNQAETAGNRIELNDERTAEASALSLQYNTDVEAAEEKVLAQQQLLDEADQQLATIIESLNAEEQQLQDQQNQANQLRKRRQELERSIQDYQRRIQLQITDGATRRGELSSTLNQKEACETRLELLERELAQTETARADLADLISMTVNDLDLSRTNVQAVREDLKDSKDALASTRHQFQEVDSSLATQIRTLTERQSKLEILNQLDEEGAGLGSGTQAVLRGLDRPELYQAAIMGALTNLIEVNAEYIPAIEGALGSYLQTVVLRDPFIAESISLDLAQKKVGRASLIPMSSLAFEENVQMELPPPGAIGWALDQIKCEPSISHIVGRLLRGIAVTPDLSSAFEIRKSAPDLALVTLTGEYISREGVVFAGNIGPAASNSVLQRKVQIRELAQECSNIRQAIEDLELEKTRFIVEVEQRERSVRQKADAWQQSQMQVSTLEGRLSLVERQRRDAEEKARSLSWEQTNCRQRLESAIQKVDLLEKELASSDTMLNQLQSEFSTALTELDSHRGEEETLAADLNELRVRVATERQRKENLQRQRESIAVRIAELQDQIANRRRDIANYAARIEQLAHENTELRGRIDQLQGDQRVAEAEVGSLLQLRAQRIEAIDAVELNLRQLRKQLADCHDSRGHLEVRTTQLNLRLANLHEHLARRYHVDLSTLEPDWYAFQVCLREQHKRLEKSADDVSLSQAVADSAADRPIDWEFVQSAIAEMTERIDAMGPVNLDAIQEYDELEERQKFLDAQHADLVKSKAELLHVINKINATTKELFAGTFEQIRLNFQEMFSELFGGGKANLLLVDDIDPLESGIEIIAKPPGKQLQSISLLSGGERTMTAVSLLFAIYMVKPSPFCVLDEMDAQLDESNISRFIKILDRFVHQSQFVVITHNKRTIAKADILYGVTMEEHGISKLVGVKLTRRESSSEAVDLIGAQGATPTIAESFGKHGNLQSETGE